ncbi:outer membrane biogenesis protein BamB [Polystyrenella longa]|uniref:Outer membrane biogenesis protein BamB n=1 Tax=Polystyrenella longa TaxID=2528007 RepID=A0A518CPQ0_9PLAN|nr:PQQ-binding-like beta-propeller repeat protein [Polystyrenella longa]QDU81200.1 outer membrane biogenesis protein BamB [Polystyrenella longa]
MRVAAFFLLSLMATSICLASDSWTEFRGPTGNGHAADSQPAISWSETENVTWKVPIHDKGWSSPVILGNQIWITTATEDGHKLYAICIDRETGEQLHDLLIFEVESPEPVPAENSYASPTSAIEEGRVYVHYGTYGTACIDTETGTILWKRQNLKCEHEAGPNSSPMLLGEMLIMNVDGRDVQYVIALDKKTGDTIWKTDRSVDFSSIGAYQRKAYSMPIHISFDGNEQLVSPGGRAIISYDPSTGKELWKILHRGWSIAPRPVFGNDLVYAVMDHDHPELWAIRPDGRGDVTDSHIEWKLTKGIPARSSPLLIDELLFFVDRKGIASCVDAVSGESLGKARLDGNHSASPVYADGRIYFFNETGKATVVKASSDLEVIAENELTNDILMASPAIAGDSLFVRTAGSLYRIDPPTEK